MGTKCDLWDSLLNVEDLGQFSFENDGAFRTFWHGLQHSPHFPEYFPLLCTLNFPTNNPVVCVCPYKEVIGWAWIDRADIQQPWNLYALSISEDIVESRKLLVNYPLLGVSSSSHSLLESTVPYIAINSVIPKNSSILSPFVFSLSSSPVPYD